MSAILAARPGSYQVITPSYDTTGVTDLANLNSALASGIPIFLQPSNSGTLKPQYWINAPLKPVSGSFITGLNWWTASDNDYYGVGDGFAGGAMITMVPGSGFTSGTYGIDMLNETTTQYYGVDISGITLYGEEFTSGSGVGGIRIAGAWGGSFLRGVCVNKPAGDCLHLGTDPVQFNTPDAWQFLNCKFAGSKAGRGVYADDIPDSWFTDCEASTNSLDNWQINYSVNTRFSGCKGENSGSGGGWHFGGMNAGQIVTLTGCTSQYNSLDGFLFDNSGESSELGTYQLANCRSINDNQAASTYAAFRSTGCTSRIMAVGAYAAAAAYGAYEGGSSYGMCFTGSYLTGTTAATHDDGTNTHVLVNQETVPF